MSFEFLVRKKIENSPRDVSPFYLFITFLSSAPLFPTRLSFSQLVICLCGFLCGLCFSAAVRVSWTEGACVCAGKPHAIPQQPMLFSCSPLSPPNAFWSLTLPYPMANAVIHPYYYQPHTPLSPPTMSNSKPVPDLGFLP